MKNMIYMHVLVHACKRKVKGKGKRVRAKRGFEL